jgi:hypothetical protein
MPFKKMVVIAVAIAAAIAGATALGISAADHTHRIPPSPPDLQAR